jgi:hypothetical protein
MARWPTETIRFLTLEELAWAVRRLAGQSTRPRAVPDRLPSWAARERGHVLRTDDIGFRALRIMVHRLNSSHSGAQPHPGPYLTPNGGW